MANSSLASPAVSPSPSRMQLMLAEHIHRQSTIIVFYTYYVLYPSPRPLALVIVFAVQLVLQNLVVIRCHLCFNKYYPKALYNSSLHIRMDYYVPQSIFFTSFDIIRAVFSCSVVWIVLTSTLLPPMIAIVKALQAIPLCPFPIELNLAIGCFWFIGSVAITLLSILYLAILGIAVSRRVPDWDIFSVAKMRKEIFEGIEHQYDGTSIHEEGV